VADALVSDDPLYEELYDVRKEALTMGNLVEGDVNPMLNALRDKAPIHKGALRDLLGLPAHDRHPMAKGMPHYAALSYELVEAGFRNPEAFSSSIVHHMEDGDEKTMGILEMDEPEHRAYRRTIQPMFVVGRTSTWWREKHMHEIVDALIARLKAKGRADLNLDYCARIPVHTITRAIGLKGDDALKFRNAFTQSSVMGPFTAEQRLAAVETIKQMLTDLIAARRAHPEDDIVSGLIAQTLELPDGTKRPLTDKEIINNTKLVMIAGGGTSWRQLGITLWALLTHPEQLEQVRADRKLIDKAIEEAVRWNPTAPLFFRLVVQDAELGGMAIPKDSVLELSMAAANRDPTRWDNPDAYDLHRKLRGHVGFGAGNHQCLGMNVARSEMSIGINALLDAFPKLRLDPEAEAPFLTGGLEQRGISGLPVIWS
jgi:cytochrome P450